MYGGEIVESGAANDVLHAPSHPYTQALLRAILQLGGTPTRLSSIPGIVPSLMAPPKACVFAPRCAYRRPDCVEARPPTRTAHGGHAWRCVLETPPQSTRGGEPLRGHGAAPDADIVLSARNVTRVFHARKGLFGPKREIRALDGVSLDLRRGETLALIGESGSGKSTLARILLGLAEPTSGEVTMLGRPVVRPVADRTGELRAAGLPGSLLVAQPAQAVSEIIARPLRLRGERDAARLEAAVAETMELVRLPKRLLHSYPSQLSGGQRQRIAIARALVTRPEALICDEPTSALDVSVQAQILNLIDDLRAEMGLTCLIITHDMAVVHQVADRVAVMFQGLIVEQGPAGDVLARPQNDYTRKLLAAAPWFDTGPAQLEVAQ